MSRGRPGRAERAVLWVLLAHPGVDLTGGDLADLAGRAPGGIYPTLARLERQRGWLSSRWEEQPLSNQEKGIPRQRYYQLTSDGAAAARYSLYAAHRYQSRGFVDRVRNGHWPWPGDTRD